MLHRSVRICCRLGILIGFAVPGFSQSEDQGIIAPVAARSRIVVSKLKPGSVMEGEIDRPVFRENREILPLGTRIRLVVNETRKEPRPKPGIVRRAAALVTGTALPKGRCEISLRSATVVLPDGRSINPAAEVLSVLDETRLRSSAKHEKARSVIVVRFTDFLQAEAPENTSQSNVLPARAEIPAGTRARLMLMHTVSGSGSHTGDRIEARLMEPLRTVEGAVIPEGTSFEGQITRSQAPRRLYRPANVRLNFTRLRLPGSAGTQVSTVLSAADTEQGAGANMDSEGGVSGGPASKKRLAIDLGVSYATGKIVDDLLEEGIKWGFGTAVSGTAATAARYPGIGVGLLFLILQRGRDVRLPQYAELELTFTRPLVLEPGASR